MAATLIDQKSVEYYNQVIKLALETERKKLGAVNFNSKLMALALRQEFSKKEIKDLKGEQVFAFAAKNITANNKEENTDATTISHRTG